MTTNKDNSPDMNMFDLSLGEFISQVGKRQPTPGGGSVAAVTAMLGSALGQMSLGYSVGKKALASSSDIHARLERRFAKSVSMLQQLASDDVQAFSLYNEALSLDAGVEKDSAVQLALAAAINVPRELATLCLVLLEDIHTLAGACTSWLTSDVKAAGALIVAAVKMSDYNVQINISSLDDEVAGKELSAASNADVRKSETLLGAIEYLADNSFS